MKKILLSIILLLCADSLSAQVIHLQEDFNNSTLPNGWSTNSLTGGTAWSFGIDGSSFEMGNNNLDSTSMAFFDDDALGSNQVNNKAVLISPSFDNSNYRITTLEFDYNFESTGATGVKDSLIVEVFDGLNWIMVKSMIWHDCGPWIRCIGAYPHAVIDISNQSNSNCQVRFIYFDGNAWSFYAGIDNVEITSIVPFDIGVEELIAPISICKLDTNEQVTLKLMNHGSDTLRNFYIYANINNGVFVLQDTVNSIIPPFDSLNYTFNSTADFSVVGSYNIDLYVVSNFDTLNTNDTLSLILENRQVNGVPFKDDFENNPTWDMDGINKSWELGTPNGNSINSTTSGINAFCTNLSGNYNNRENSYLYSPCFDFSQITGAPILQFNLNYITEPFFDNLQLEYSIDERLTWNRVEEEVGSNWYQGTNSWEGNSLGWVVAKNTLLGLIGQSNVQFRFRFSSDGSAEFEGIAIDDFEILLSDSIDLSIEIVNPDTLNYSICGIGNENIVVSIGNLGYTNVDSISLYYQVNGGQIINELMLDTINMYEGKSYRFSNSFDFSAAGTYLIKAWLQLAGDTNNINDTTTFQFIQKTTVGNDFIMGYNLEDFDTFYDGSCLGTPSTYAGDTLRKGWTEASTGAFRWNVQSGTCNGTTTSNTGPFVDHTTGNGNFLYTEAPVLHTNGVAQLESPCVDFSNSSTAGIKFWYHRYGMGMGNFYIDIYANGVWNEGVDSLIGQSQTSSNDTWKLKKVVFNQFSNQLIKVRFRVMYGLNYLGDMAIDDIEFYNPIANDGRMLDVELLNSSCEYDSALLKIVVDNFGTNTIGANQLKLRYKLDGGSTLVDSNSIAIAVDSSQVFTYNLSGLYTNAGDKITAWVELPNDSNQFNDTLSINYEQLTKTPEYIEGFENLVSSNGFCGNYNTPLNLDWEIEVNDQWVAGHDTICRYGAQGATPTALTGPDSAYAGHGFMHFEPGFNSVVDTAILTSTCVDLRNDSISYLDFYYHMYGAGTGKLYIDAKSTGGWVRLDSIVGQQHFSISDPWSLKLINLNQFSGDIMRLRFTAIESLGTNSDEGAISIDNVRISNSFPVSINETKTSNSFQLFPNPTNGEFILRGKGFSTYELVISLLDLNGRLIETRIVNPTTDSINERFDLSNQANGVYLISIQSEGKVEVKKVVLSGR